MIPKKQRIKKRLFSESFSYSKSVSNDILTLKYKPISDFPTKLSVVVSKKVEKSAVLRNKLKRTLYVLALKLTKNSKKPYIIMIFPKKQCVVSKNNEKENALKEVLFKATIV